MHPDPRKIIVFDIDGTLADIGHRLHYIKAEIKDWDGFHSSLNDDELKKDIAELLAGLRYANLFKILIVTGRMEKYRNETELWLEKHGIEHDGLHMRPNGNFDPDYKIKQAIIEELGASNILMAIDDRKQIVDTWRRNGITCLQCQDGDY